MSFEVDTGIPSIVGSSDGLKIDTSGAIPADQDYTFTASFPVDDWYRIVSIHVRLDARNSPATPRVFIRHDWGGTAIQLARRDGIASSQVFLVTGDDSTGRINSPALEHLVGTVFPPTLDLELFFQGLGAAADSVTFGTNILWTGD